MYNPLPYSENIKTSITQPLNQSDTEADFLDGNNDHLYQKTVIGKPFTKSNRKVEVQDETTVNSTSQLHSQIHLTSSTEDFNITNFQEKQSNSSTERKKSKKSGNSVPDVNGTSNTQKQEGTSVSKYLPKQSWRNFLKASPQGQEILSSLQQENKKDPEKNKYWGKKMIRKFLAENSPMVMTINGRDLKIRAALIYYIEKIFDPSFFSSQVTQATRDYFINHKREVVEDILGHKVYMDDVREAEGSLSSVNVKRRGGDLRSDLNNSAFDSDVEAPVRKIAQMKQAWSDIIVNKSPEDYVDYSSSESNNPCDPFNFGVDISNYDVDNIDLYFDMLSFHSK